MNLLEKPSAHDFDKRADHVKIVWKEELDKQKYDKVNLASKIGNTKEPFIKSLHMKTVMSDPNFYKKIGESQEIPRIKKDKHLDLKIGHPEDKYVYQPKKEREDGFLANRKVIEEANYTRSAFFFTDDK
jgi:hypothetical protein